ncbi:MAG: 50S ribosomal protein L13 [Candidatus Brennerbacteria bacterium]|nr:50S ribosomal protein L13 [Candidatus Brennerbacteria bacterium]
MKYEIDAQNKILGRLASQIAGLLQGKNSASYNPRLAGDNSVLVKNAGKIAVSGKKDKQKVYYHHTGYIGHLKEVKFEALFKKDPSKVLKMAVRKMLPHNRLRAQRLKKLIIEK